MTLRSNSRLGRLAIALVTGWLALAVQAAPLAPQAWPVDTAERQMTRDVVAILQNKHFRKLALDDALSAQLLDNYLAVLDPNRQIFLQSDIDEFFQYRDRLDDELGQGNLATPRNVYQRYHDRYAARLRWLLQQVDPLVAASDFTVDETIEIDRESSPWPANMAAADDLWRRYVKNSALGLVLADKPQADISKTLQRRFQTQLDRLEKQTAMDHFELFMNAYTELYDPHTNFLSPKSSENFDISMSLSLEGIGAVLEKEDEFTKVVRLVPGGPADKQGELKPGDHIVAIGQGQHPEEWSDVIGWRLDEVVEIIRGKADTWVTLQVKRGENDMRTIGILREKVKLEDQAASKRVIELKDPATGQPRRLGVIGIPTFYLDFEALRRKDPDTKSTTRDVIRILDELKAEKVDGIIVDLRNNGGGSLREATLLTDLFIDKGPVVQILNSDNQVDRRNRAVDPPYYNGPLLVLVNHLSASASEIFAGAIQDYERGLIVGEQTFGKGTVQTVIPLYQGKLKITEAKFYRVSGDSTQHRGVIPDISYPSLLSFDDVGESALKHALPWDRIQAAPHYHHGEIRAYLPALQARHDARMKDSTEYRVLLEQQAIAKTERERKSLSLNQARRVADKREQEKRVLDLNNAIRQARGKPPYQSVKELEEDMARQREARDPADDFLLMESARILKDYMDESARSPAALQARQGVNAPAVQSR